MSPSLDHRHLARCSDDLRAATAAVEAWGRARWPGSRVIHELNVGGSRLDIAFVQPNHVAGVEIKSDRDTLDRLDAQVRDYLREIPEVWVAVAPKWQSELADIPRKVGRIVVDNGAVTDQITVGPYTWRMPAEVDAALTVQMMHLLWRAELSDIGHRFGVRIPSRLPIGPAIGLLARKMTGDQIVTAVCSALRARPFRFAADPPLAWPSAHSGEAA